MIPARARSPRLQAWLLAFVLLAAGLKAVALHRGPGVAERDLTAVAATARARGSAKVSVRFSTKLSARRGMALTGEGVASFADGRSRVVMTMPVLRARGGTAPQWEVRAVAGRGYLTGGDTTEWLSFPDPRAIAPGAPTAASLLAALERHGRVSRSGGDVVRGVSCDRYESPHPGENGWRLTVWVDRDALPRRVEWAMTAGRSRGTYRVDLHAWGAAAPVGVPPGARDVHSVEEGMNEVGFA